jgi:predicted phosphodiesterase
VTASRVAVISDVHGNATALEAVLAEVDAAEADVVVFGGDLTWGPLPAETLGLVRPYADRAIFIRGNAERMLLELAAGEAEPAGDRDRWMPKRHDAAALEVIGGFVEWAVVDVEGLGLVRFCHGSPRSDEELVTPATPEVRMRALLEGVDEQVLVTAHTHLQFDRRVAGVRSVNAGSVGMPYQGEPGAFWALLGPDVDLRRTPYDVDAAVERYRASGDPAVEQMVEILLEPPTPAEMIEHAERLEFSG